MSHNIDISKFSPKTLETFNKIVSCSKEEFSNKGYVNTTISSIAKCASISVGCIYKYFENKYELYKFIIDNEQMKIRDHLNKAIKQCSTREKKEEAGLRAWLTYVRDNPGIYKLIWESLFIDMEAFVYYYSTFSKSYSNALSKDKDELTDDDLSTISYMLIGISNFLGVKLMIEKDMSDEHIDEIVTHAMKVLKNGLLK
jgi:AcrR family transcriptional regulator